VAQAGMFDAQAGAVAAQPPGEGGGAPAQPTEMPGGTQ
jgi:hypothetical protein